MSAAAWPTPCAGYWCSQGNRVPCPKGTFLSARASIDMGDCLPCPTHATTLGLAATSLADCQCDSGWFLTMDAEGVAVCEACPLPGTACDEPGVTLATLPLSPQYWRSGNTSTDPRPCTAYSNVDGDKRCLGGTATCAGLLSGVYCTACPAETYLDGSGECLDCTGLSAASVGVVAAFALAATLLLAVLLCSVRAGRKLGSSGVARRASSLAEASGLPAKAKQLLSFCTRRLRHSPQARALVRRAAP